MEHSRRHFQESELVLNDDGSIYHLKLLPQHVAQDVILVGDPGRVAMVSEHFDSIEFQISNREFHTHTGIYEGKRITVLSSGIGTDNIDIVVNELDAAVNIDLENRVTKDEKTSLNLIRLGTSGALQPDLEVDSMVISKYGLGLDGLLHYYDYDQSAEEGQLNDEILDHLDWNPKLPEPYIVKGSEDLINKLGQGMTPGITATATGFYGPQGRALNLEPSNPQINDRLTSFNSELGRVINFEMETSALYGLGKMLGHNCCTCCVILANRIRKEYSLDYKKAVNEMISLVLDRI